MTSNNTAENIIRELGNRLGLSLSVSEGAAVLEDSKGQNWWLEAPAGSELLLIHTKITDQASDDPDGVLRHWLSLNTHTDLMKGSWIGLHEDTNSIRLCAQAPLELLDATLLENMLSNLVELFEALPRYSDRVSNVNVQMVPQGTRI